MYKVISILEYSMEVIENKCNEMYEKGYRLHSVVSIPQEKYSYVRLIFESMDVIATPIQKLNRRLEYFEN
jgi:hypothetical protein